MTLTPTRYVLRERHLRPRSWRVWSLFLQNVSLTARTGPLIIATLGFLILFIPLLVALVLAELLGGAPSISIQTFAGPFSSGVFSALGSLLFFLLLLMTTFVGSGIIADDLRNRTIALYLSRPITFLDYLIAKACTVGAYLALLCMLPGLIIVLTVGVLGLATTAVVGQAFGAYLGVGLLLTAFLSGLALFLSSLTERRAFAAVAIFTVLLFDDLLAGILAGATGQSSWLYVSPWQDVRQVAQAAFSYTPAGPLDPWTALAVVLGLTAVLYAAVYVRLAEMQVVSD